MAVGPVAAAEVGAGVEAFAADGHGVGAARMEAVAGSQVILIAPTGQTLDDIAELAADLQARGADLIVTSDAPDLLARANFPLPLAASVPEWLSPITAILPGQILALHLAQAKGINPDLPRGLQKVTKTL